MMTPRQIEVWVITIMFLTFGVILTLSSFKIIGTVQRKKANQ